MLKVDLRRLSREGTLFLHEEIPPERPLWTGLDAPPSGPVTVDLEVTGASGDVVARGSLEGHLELPCRRCLDPAGIDVHEDVTFVFRRGIGDREAEEQGVFPLAKRDTEVDLEGPVREQWILAAPAYILCAVNCRGMCPRCGADLNEGSCRCRPEEVDSRWGPLLNMKDD